MNVKERLEELRKKMKARNIDFYYVPSSDPHMSEYLPEHYKTRAFISGFTGSAGAVVVTADKAGLWTDGRYFLQAGSQLEGTGIDLYKMGEPGVPTIPEFLNQEADKGSRLGADCKSCSVTLYNSIAKKNPQIEFVTDLDLIGEIWTDRPQLKASDAFILDVKYSGKDAKEKIAEVRRGLEDHNANATIIGALEDVCYLFNIRGSDVKCNPVVTSYALVDKERAILFVNKNQVGKDVQNYLESQGVVIMDYESVFTEAEKLSGNVYLDFSRTNVFLKSKITAKIIEGKNLTVDMKSVKNDVEIENFKKTMKIDGVAMVKIMKWVVDNADKGINELDVSKKLHDFRSEGEGFIEDSFESISGYGANGAIVHYGPTEESAATLQPKSFLLLDSGGHYYTGTTDITRTIPLGPLTDEEKEDYTYVLKSHIRLAMAKFKNGTTGFALDAICRQPLWAAGKDYNHGTGHGVGYLLSVHEGPQSISQRASILEPIKTGMITSNEPGMYIAGKYGIRIENLVVTREHLKTEYGLFNKFETLTLAPISTKPVIKELLSDDEVKWLNDYNATVCEALSPQLDKEHKEFLIAETKAI